VLKEEGWGFDPPRPEEKAHSKKKYDAPILKRLIKKTSSQKNTLTGGENLATEN